MSRLGETFDQWVTTGPFTAVDVGRYRVVFAALTLLALPDYDWAAQYPDSLYNPPVGPFRMFDGFPSETAFMAIEVLLAVALAALLIGFHTTAASFAVSLLMLSGSGFAYSLGKIDHTIFAVVTPAVMAFARWGDAVSLDAVVRGDRPARPTPQWAMRLLALLIGAGFLTAAVPKLLAGWLDPRTQALQETTLRQYYVAGSNDFLAAWAVAMPVRGLWELGDWGIVLLESLIIVAVLSWRWFRTSLAVLACFHLVVLLSININFVTNVLVYAAFVAWSAFRLPRWHLGAPLTVTGARWVGWILAPLLGVGLWAAQQSLGDGLPGRSVLILLAGAAVGAWYLVRQVRTAYEKWVPRSARGRRVRPTGDAP